MTYNSEFSKHFIPQACGSVDGGHSKPCASSNYIKEVCIGHWTWRHSFEKITETHSRLGILAGCFPPQVKFPLKLHFLT